MNNIDWTHVGCGGTLWRMSGLKTGATTRHAATRLVVGQAAPRIEVPSLAGDPIFVPDPTGSTIHLQFRRFAGCPVCNLHLRSVAKRIDELRAASVREVAVFHSEASTMMPFQGDLPFDVIADPTKSLYRAFGVEASPASLLDPRAWLALVRGATAGHPSGVAGEGGYLGLPADFLIGRDGLVLACKYGVHADDQWSVDDVIHLVLEQRGSSTVRSTSNRRSPGS